MPSGFRISLWLFCAAVFVFITGCAQTQTYPQRSNATRLFVDASELRQNPELRDQSIEKLNQAVQENDKFFPAYSLLGQIYKEDSEYNKSAGAYQKATELNPWSFDDHHDLGFVYEKLEDFPSAAVAYERAVELNPDSLDANIGATRSNYIIKNYEKALFYGNNARRIDPQVRIVYELLGNIHEATKDYESAIQSYKRALELDSDDPDTMLALGIAYLRTDRVEPASELLTQFVKIQPNNTTAHQHLGYAYLTLYQKTVATYNRELKIDPDNSELLDNLRDKALDYISEAINSYSTTVEIDSRDWESHRGLGVAYVFKSIVTGDDSLRESAVTHWRQSLRISPNQPRAEQLVQYIQKYSR